MKKKLVSIMLVAAMALSVVACGSTRLFVGSVRCV